jgi:hypothetical protein
MVKKKVSNKKVPVSGGMNKNLVIGVVVVLLLVGVFWYFNNQKEVGLSQPMEPKMPESGEGDSNCKQAMERCGEKHGKCCDEANKPGASYDGLPLSCDQYTEEASFCIPQCTFTEIEKPLSCAGLREDEDTGDLSVSFTCCKQEDLCVDTDKGFGCVKYCSIQGSIPCGNMVNCCDVRDKDGDGLPDKACIFYPNPAPGEASYRCETAKVINKCPDTKAEMCRIKGDYLCMTTNPTSQCSEGIDKCCFAHETCVPDKDYQFGNCLPSGQVECKENGKYSFSCKGGEECCGDKCCEYGTRCNFKNGKQICEDIDDIIDKIKDKFKNKKLKPKYRGRVYS